jgi:hypothetical protein
MLYKTTVRTKTSEVSLSSKIRSKFNYFDLVFWSVADRECIVTSAIDSFDKHKRVTKHRDGEAVDLRTRDLETKQIQCAAKLLRAILGKDYDVVVEYNHIHVEYDPKDEA